MRKYLILIVLILFMTGCTNNDVEITNDDDNNQNEEIVTVEEPKYVDDNPIKVGLYLNGKLMNEYTTAFVNDKDIISVDTYFTQEENVGSSNTKYNFNKYYNNYENIDNYKIGYYVSFDTNEKHYEKVVLDADVEFAVAPYIYIYLYDDIHQPDGAWYSHVTKDEYNDDTIFSSIKLYMAERCEEINSPITLTVFTYDDMDDFDDDGYYRGNSSHTLIIKNG